MGVEFDDTTSYARRTTLGTGRFWLTTLVMKLPFVKDEKTAQTILFAAALTLFIVAGILAWGTFYHPAPNFAPGEDKTLQINV